MRLYAAWAAFLAALVAGRFRSTWAAVDDRLLWTYLMWGLLLVAIAVAPARLRYRAVTAALVAVVGVVGITEEYDSRRVRSRLVSNAASPAGTVGR